MTTRRPDGRTTRTRPDRSGMWWVWEVFGPDGRLVMGRGGYLSKAGAERGLTRALTDAVDVESAVTGRGGVRW